MSALATSLETGPKTRKTSQRAREGLNRLQESLFEGVKLLDQTPEGSPGWSRKVFGRCKPSRRWRQPSRTAPLDLIFGAPEATSVDSDTSTWVDSPGSDLVVGSTPASEPPRETAPEQAVTALDREIPEVEISDAELRSAAELLDLVASSPHPAQDVADHLETIEDLLPALFEMNIRQANADGRPDLAASLRALLDSPPLQQKARAGRRASLHNGDGAEAPGAPLVPLGCWGGLRRGFRPWSPACRPTLAST